MSVANERLLDRVRHFVEPRLAYIGLRVGEFWRQALAVLSVWSLSGQGPEPFPHRVGPNGQTAARIFFLGVRWGQNRILVLLPPKNGIRFRTIEQTSEHQLDQARKAGFEIDDDNAVFDNGTSGMVYCNVDKAPLEVAAGQQWLLTGVGSVPSSIALACTVNGYELHPEIEGRWPWGEQQLALAHTKRKIKHGQRCARAGDLPSPRAFAGSA